MGNKLITTALAAVALTAAGCSEGYGGDGRYGGYGGYGGPGYDASQYAGRCYPGERRDDCRERLRYQRENQSQYVWRDGQYYREDSSGRGDAAGAAIAGGIIGFILGAAVAGSTSDRDYVESHRGDRGWRDRCATTYPGFDPNTGTYPGPDGMRRYCTR